MDRTHLVPNEELGYGSSEIVMAPPSNSGSLNSENNDDSASSRRLDKANEGGMTGALLMLTMLSAIGGFLFGYDTGVISGAMISLREVFHLTPFWQELVVSSAIGAAAISALASGYLNDRFGRKIVILLASFVFTVGSILMAISEVKEFLLVGRIVVGLGIGLASMTVPVYIAETAPSHLRGKLVLSNNIFITAGMLTASIIDGLFYSDKVNGWKFMLGLAGVPSAMQFIGFLFMPESPRWLVGQRRHSHAKNALERIRKSTPEDINAELEEIKLAHMDSINASQVAATDNIEEYDGFITRNNRSFDNSPTIIRMLRQGSTRRALIVGCGLQMFQQIAGINTVMYYSATIISMSGIQDQQNVVWMAAAVSAINVLFSFVGLYFIDRVGRRKLALASLFGVLFSLIVLAVGFQLSVVYTPSVGVIETPYDHCAKYDLCDPCINDDRCGFCFQDDSHSSAINASCLPTNDTFSENSLLGRCSSKASRVASSTTWAHYCPTVYSWIAIIGLPMYLAFFAPGMGPIPWTINAEIYPLWARSTGTAAATAVNWIFNLIISITFLSLTKAITAYGAYYLYSGFVVLAILFVFRCVPETKGKTLEDIETLFETPWF